MIYLNDITNWKHQRGRVADRFKIYLKNKKTVCIELDNISNSAKNSEIPNTLENFLISNGIN